MISAGRTYRRAGAWMLLACVMSSCMTDTGTDDVEPTAGIIRLTISAQQINIDQSGNITGGVAVIRAGVAAAVTAVFLTPSGEEETRVNRASYQLNITTIGSQPISFTPSTTDPFAGTITCNVPNQTLHMRVSLYNIDKQHDTWGPFEVPFVVSN